MFRKTIGLSIAAIGAPLWERGGWTGDEQYQDLSIFGKIGYQLFATGLKIAGIDETNIDQFIECNNL